MGDFMQEQPKREYFTSLKEQIRRIEERLAHLKEIEEVLTETTLLLKNVKHKNP